MPETNYKSSFLSVEICCFVLTVIPLAWCLRQMLQNALSYISSNPNTNQATWPGRWVGEPHIYQSQHKSLAWARQVGR